MIDGTSLDELRAYYAQGRLLPFIGAGVSMSVEWLHDEEFRRGPSWAEFVDQAARMLGFEDPDLLRVRGEDLQILEYFRAKNDGRIASLTNWLVQRMTVTDNVLVANPILKELALLAKCRLFYTTNFDSFIERAFRLHGRPTHVVAAESEIGELLASRSTDEPDMCEVVKFHGDLDHPDQMVVSEQDYRRRLALATIMDDRLKSDLLGRVVLFLGYSFRDWNVSYLYHVVNELHGGAQSETTKRGYITVPDPSEFEIELFRARRIRVIPISSGAAATTDTADVLSKISEGAT